MNKFPKKSAFLDAVQAIVSKMFGNATTIAGIIELKDGYYNSAHHIKLDNEFQFVLKIAPDPKTPCLRYERDILIAEIESMKLTKINTDMPIPDILYSDTSTNLIGSPYYCMEYIQGVPLNKIRKDLSPLEAEAIDQTLGKFLRQMNSLSGNQFGCFIHPEKPGTSWSCTFEKLLSNVLQDGEDVDIELPSSRSNFIELVQQYRASLDEVSTPALIHWDLWDGNVFIDPKTKQINGIIDFERSLWADPLMEVNFGAFGINHNFLKGYGQHYPFSTLEQNRRTLYNIYLFLIMIIECTYRQYPTKDQENWARIRLSEEINKI